MPWRKVYLWPLVVLQQKTGLHGNRVEIILATDDKKKKKMSKQLT